LEEDLGRPRCPAFACPGRSADDGFLPEELELGEILEHARLVGTGASQGERVLVGCFPVVPGWPGLHLDRAMENSANHGKECTGVGCGITPVLGYVVSDVVFVYLWEFSEFITWSVFKLVPGIRDS